MRKIIFFTLTFIVLCPVWSRAQVGDSVDVRDYDVTLDLSNGTPFPAYADITVQYLSFGEAASALKDGNVDVAFVTAGYPTAAIQDIASQRKVRLIPVDAATADRLIAKYPFYTKTKIPAGTYAGFDQDVSAVSVMAMLVTTDKMDDALGGEIAKALFSNLDRLKAAHSVGKLITKEGAMNGMSVKMNGGAEQFFKK